MPNQTEENKQGCCEKCYSTYTEHDYPAHTTYDACINPMCACHTQKASTPTTEGEEWEIEFGEKFVTEHSFEMQGHSFNNDSSGFIDEILVTPTKLKSFIRSLLQSEWEKGRKEIYDELDKLLVNGHGGGNWRRLVMELKSKFNL